MIPTEQTAVIVSRYPASHRRVDVCAIVLFGALALPGVLRLSAGLEQWGWPWLMAAALTGWLTVDLLSGLVHWAFDTWGSVHTPLLGARYIRPFREHHHDPLAITRHDFVETNGSSCLAALPLLIAATLVPVEGSGYALAHALLLFIALGVLITNQCHRWAHLPAQRMPLPVRIAQKLRLILRPEDHLCHHVPPFDSHYCTAAGWLNRPLHAIGLFRALECWIAAATRLRAREDDPR